MRLKRKRKYLRKAGRKWARLRKHDAKHAAESEDNVKKAEEVVDHESLDGEVENMSQKLMPWLRRVMVRMPCRRSLHCVTTS